MFIKLMLNGLRMCMSEERGCMHLVYPGTVHGNGVKDKSQLGKIKLSAVVFSFSNLSCKGTNFIHCVNNPTLSLRTLV